MPNILREVTWRIPKELWERIDKAKAAGQLALDIPLGVSDEGFGVFLLDRAVQLYEDILKQEATKRNLIVDPFATEYKGQRTPR